MSHLKRQAVKAHLYCTKSEGRGDIVSNLCIYTTVASVATKIKEKHHFRLYLHSNINQPIGVH